jgi:rubrerythrin
MDRYSINEIIEIAVQVERNGYKYYAEAAQRKDLPPEGKQLLMKLRDDEILHEKTFKDLRSDEELLELKKTKDWDIVTEYLEAIGTAHIFLDEEASIKMATNAKSFEEIIENAIRFEKDTIMLYHTLSRTLSSKKAIDIIHRIIREEMQHVLWLKGILG